MDERYPPGIKRKQNLPLSMLPYLPVSRGRILSSLVVFLIFLFIFIGYLVVQNNSYHKIIEELERNEAIWSSLEIEDYQYMLRVSDYYKGSATVAIRVEDGNSAIVKRLESRYRGEITDILPMDITNYDTVSDLFDRIRQAVEDREEDGGRKLAIIYDEETGYPLRIALVPSEPYYGSMYEYDVTDFKILESADSRYARLEDELVQARQLWETGGSFDYGYTLIVRTQELDARVSITVRNGVAVIDTISGKIPENIDELNTVPGLFSRIERAITGKEENGFDRLRIVYDAKTGFPTYFALRDSYNAGDPGVYSYSITDFEKLD